MMNASSFRSSTTGFARIAVIEDRSVRVFSRFGRDLLKRFPEVASIGDGFRRGRYIIDGELCADDGSVSSFWRLLSRRTCAPVISFVAFDLLEARGKVLVDVPLEERLARLSDVVPAASSGITIAGTFDWGIELFRLAEMHGLEGIVCKRRRSLYHCGRRSPDWRKVKTSHAKRDAAHRRTVFDRAL